MKRFSLTTLITFFLLLSVTALQAQLDNKAEELMKVLRVKDCTAAINLVNSIQSANYVRVDGLSLLMSAASSGCTEVVKILVDKGANIDLQHKEYKASALMLASQLGYTEIVKLLLEKGAKVDLQFSNGGTALMLASQLGFPAIVKLLLEKGANVNIQRPDGGTALIVAAVEGHAEIVKLLLQNGANVELKTVDSGQTALMLASANNNTDVVKLLSNNVVKPDLKLIESDLKTFTDPRDGKVYKTVKIGNEIWMAENLAYLPSVSPSSAGSETSPMYYVYDYQGTDVNAAKETANFKLYGVLYNWEAAKSACPSGWHLPALVGEIVLTNDLIEYLRDNGYGYGQYKDIGKSMASTSGWNSYSVAGTVGNDQVSNNKSGFSALPGGFRYSDGSFKDKLNNAGFWTSKPDVFNPGSHANGLVLYYANQGLIQYKTFKSAGLSVRCIKDK